VGLKTTLEFSDRLHLRRKKNPKNEFQNKRGGGKSSEIEREKKKEKFESNPPD